MHSQFLDPQTPQPRAIPWTRWLLIAFGVFAVIAVGIYWWFRSYTTITVAADTTYLTAPLLADGYPDYLGYLNAQNSAGVTAENNAWVAILRICGPGEIDDESRAEHFRLLGIAPLAEHGDYFRPFNDYSHFKQLPDEILIAASVAVQMPYHVRFVRLAALNADKHAQQTTFGMFGEVFDPEYFVLTERLNETIAAAATASHEYAADPLIAELLEGTADIEPAETEFIGDDEYIQDLRESALNLIKPMFTYPEEETEWRKTIFGETAQKLLDRESLIAEERPWTRAECPLAAQWLDQYSGRLDRLAKELPNRQKFYVPLVADKESRAILAASLPAIQALRNLSRAYQLRALYHLHQQNTKGAIQDFATQIQLSSYCQQSPLLVETLIAYALHGMASATLGEILLSKSTTDDQLLQLAMLLEPQRKISQPSQCIDQGERLMAVDCVLQIVVNKEKGLFDDSYWDQTIVCWDEVLRELNHQYDNFSAAAKTGDIRAMRQVSQNITAHSNASQYKEWFKQRPWYLLPSQRTEVVKYVYSEMFLPALAATFQAHLRAVIRNDLARLYVALERFHRAQGAYPAALAELVPAYLPAVPSDLIDGQPLRYQRTPVGGYRAYSIWINGIDDGGTPVVSPDGEVIDYQANDLVIGSPDEMTRKQLFGW